METSPSHGCGGGLPGDQKEVVVYIQCHSGCTDPALFKHNFIRDDSNTLHVYSVGHTVQDGEGPAQLAPILAAASQTLLWHALRW